MNTTSLYFHIPFCKQRCGYCDFNTFAGLSNLISPTVNAICEEQRFISKASVIPIHIGTIFFGGGTPSLLDATALKKIVDTTRICFEVDPGAEISLEANPGTITKRFLHEIREIGFNRISLGMQTSHPDELRVLNRIHRHDDVIKAVQWCKQVGFERINLDLIFGIPGQTQERWQDSLKLAMAENVDHLSLYSLSVEEGTPLKRWIDRGLLSAPDDDLAGEMYESAIDTLNAANYEQYEISNWAKNLSGDHRCQHNLQYWRFLPYLGFGPGAHGFFDGIRTENVAGVLEYINKIKFPDESWQFPGSPACLERRKLLVWDQMQEYLMVGFRLTQEGISYIDFRERFGCNLTDFFSKQIIRLTNMGLIEKHPELSDRLRLTRKGCLFGNQVFAEFVGNKIPREFLEPKP